MRFLLYLIQNPMCSYETQVRSDQTSTIKWMLLYEYNRNYLLFYKKKKRFSVVLQPFWEVVTQYGLAFKDKLLNVDCMGG